MGYIDIDFLCDFVSDTNDKVDLDHYRKLAKGRLVFIRRHPKHPINLITYTPKTKKTRLWSKETVAARGLVVDDHGNILARPFPAFFNYSEIKGELPAGPMEVYDKLDGSLIIMFFYEGVPIFTTKGAFETEQANKAKQIFDAKYKELKLNKAFTYCFEVIYPKNKIVVEYGEEEDIFLIAKIETSTGKEESIDGLGFRTVEKFPNVKSEEELKSLRALDIENKEGFVAKFQNNLRVKLKFTSYLRLHKTRNISSEQYMLNWLIKGHTIPEQESEESNRIKNVLSEKFLTKKEAFTLELETILNSTEDNKDIIRRINSSSQPKILFCLKAGKNCDHMIWRLMKDSNS